MYEVGGKFPRDLLIMNHLFSVLAIYHLNCQSYISFVQTAVCDCTSWGS